jgi:hypothetical protein
MKELLNEYRKIKQLMGLTEQEFIIPKKIGNKIAEFILEPFFKSSLEKQLKSITKEQLVILKKLFPNLEKVSAESIANEVANMSKLDSTTFSFLKELEKPIMIDGKSVEGFTKLIDAFCLSLYRDKEFIRAYQLLKAGEKSNNVKAINSAMNVLETFGVESASQADEVMSVVNKIRNKEYKNENLFKKGIESIEKNTQLRVDLAASKHFLDEISSFQAKDIIKDPKNLEILRKNIKTLQNWAKDKDFVNTALDKMDDFNTWTSEKSVFWSTLNQLKSKNPGLWSKFLNFLTKDRASVSKGESIILTLIFFSLVGVTDSSKYGSTNPIITDLTSKLIKNPEFKQ